MQFFGRARKGGEIETHGNLCLISCGLNYAAFNAAMLCSPVSSDIHAFAAQVETATRFFRARALRWTWWLCDDHVESSISREYRSALNRFGLHRLTEAPGMYAERLSAPPSRLPELEIRPVKDSQTRIAFASITSKAFDIPQSICDAVYGSEKGWNADFQGYVGYASGQPVTTTAVVVAAGAAGIYSVATLAPHRRRGYADCIMRHALNEIKKQRGIERTVLQATRPGFRLYEKMGYRRVTNFRVYISD